VIYRSCGTQRCGDAERGRNAGVGIQRVYEKFERERVIKRMNRIMKSILLSDD